jgi:hypothetical protein
MSLGQCPHLMKSPDLIALVGRVRDTVTDVEYSHGNDVVGAAGFEPTASLVFKSGCSNR